MLQQTNLKLDQQNTRLGWILVFLTFLAHVCDSLPLPSSSNSQPAYAVGINAHQWQSLLKDVGSLMRKQLQHQQNLKKEQVPLHHKPKTRLLVDPNYTESGSIGNIRSGNGGLLKLRNIRSDDLAGTIKMLSLHNLHELEREWAGRARPRFGKRAEVIEDIYLPPYILPFPDNNYNAQAQDEIAGGYSSKVYPEEGEEFYPDDHQFGRISEDYNSLSNANA